MPYLQSSLKLKNKFSLDLEGLSFPRNFSILPQLSRKQAWLLGLLVSLQQGSGTSQNNATVDGKK